MSPRSWIPLSFGCRLPFVAGVLGIGALTIACQARDAISERSVTNALALACTASAPAEECVVRRAVRFEDASGAVAQYSVQVRVGPGPYDRIGLHRVVRERSPWRPASALPGVFFIHGAAGSFERHFLLALGPELLDLSGDPEDRGGLALFLARRGVDVWGIDLRWSLIADDPSLPPPEDEEATCAAFSFMKAWNTGTHASDVGVALGIARSARALSGGDFGRMILGGYSRGAQIAYAYAGQETQVPSSLRHVRGLIGMDIDIKLDPADPRTEGRRERACNLLLLQQARVAAGCHVADGRTFLRFAELALSAPNTPSEELQLALPPGYCPILQGQFPSIGCVGNNVLPLTYREVAVVRRAAGWRDADIGGALPILEFSHHWSADFAVHPVASALLQVPIHLPVELALADTDTVLRYTAAEATFQSLNDSIDLLATLCDDPALAEVPYDDLFSQIAVPVLYVGAEGGIGEAGVYSVELMDRSEDREVVIARNAPGSCPPDADGDGSPDLLYRPGQNSAIPFPRVACAIGHIDLLSSTVARQAVWEPVLRWVERH